MEVVQFLTVGLAFLVSLLSPLVVIPSLLRRNIVDLPNGRSSHEQVAVRGVGISPTLGLLAGLGLLLFWIPDPARGSVIILAVTAFLAAGLGFVEDVRGVPVRIRATLQGAIGLLTSVAIGLQFTQPWWLLVIFAVGIAAYVNVANFMDGIDGMSGLHGVVVGCFFGFLGNIQNLSWLSVAGWIVAAVFLGFLPWNLFRKGTFLGDVGSYLLGAVVAVIATLAVAAGVSALVALAPLAIYVFDTGTTLVRRVLKGERWFEAHRSHSYQRLTQLGIPHLAVASIVALGMVLTGSMGLLVAEQPALWPVLVVGLVIVVIAYLSLPFALASIQRRNSQREVPAV
jgi:UDP-N-acetylmuramyl pentapeptide phosphotransferase/UDP-N-acetylglucosamine-1-phosphate transferase